MKHYNFLKLIMAQLLLIVACIDTSAQTASDGVWDVPRTGGDAITEPSPEATAMRRYQDYPISYATGTADISIPLFGLQSGDLGISLGLNYHTGGIKKTDIATNIGLGWSLTGLGYISRQINGFPDEWRGYSNNVSFDLKIDTHYNVDYLESVLKAKKDVEYDRYNYSIDGYSGTFYIVDGAVVEYPASELNITFTTNNVDNSGEISKFEIRTPQGKVYTFEYKESIEVKSYSTQIVVPDMNSRDYTAVSQWNLSKIKSCFSQDSITISYKPRKEWTRISDKMISGHSFVYTPDNNQIEKSQDAPIGLSFDEQTTFRNHSIPYRISSRSGKIEFSTRTISNAPFVDAPVDYISGIKLMDLKGNVIREAIIDNDAAFRDKRIKLNKINILCDGTIVDRYQFSYNDLTDDLSYDFFGYPNGKGNLPGYSHSVINHLLERSIYRESDSRYIADNCLTEIKNIAGLRTSITYEPAKIDVNPFYSDYVFKGSTTVGLRIKSIETIDTITGRKRKRDYEYKNPVCDIPLGKLTLSDYISQSGIHIFHAFNKPTTYSLGISFTPSATLRGMPVDNASLFYENVSETVTGSDIPHPIVTEYEYDLSDIESTLILSGRVITDIDINFGNNPENAKSLAVLQYTSNNAFTDVERVLLKSHATRGYLSQTIGNAPRLTRRIEKEWTPSGYRTRSTEESYYSKTDISRFTYSLYCESVVFKYHNLANGLWTLNITDFEDVNHFYTDIASYRTVCDSTIKTIYYPDGNSRKVKTAYINTVNSGNGGRFPGFYTDSIQSVKGVAFSPMGVTVSSGDESISTYTALSESVKTGECFNIVRTGLRKLPVVEKWVVRTPCGNDSSLRQTDYGVFGAKHLVRPRAVSVSSAECDRNKRVTISRQHYSDYDNNGRIADMTDATGRRIKAKWDADYDMLTEMSLPDAGLSTTYTHIPLVGYTSITSPSGKKRQFEYQAGRLTAEKNTAGQKIASYSYSLYGETEGSDGKNLITSTLHDDAGDAIVSKLYDGFGLPVRTLTTVAGGKFTSTSTTYDALDRPVRQYLPVPASSIGENPDAASYYGDPYPYKSVTYRDLASDSPISIISEGQLMQDNPAKAEYLCNSTGEAMLRCVRYILGADRDKETIDADGYYPAGTLDVVRATDPDGHVTLSFTDWRGFKVLERKVLNASIFADTYWLYDAMGRTRVAIQPEGAAQMTSTSGSWDNKSVPLSKYAFIYRYDRRGNCIYSHVPGGGPVEMRYDAYNRPAFRSTAMMAYNGQTEYTLYDIIGRAVVTGIADCDIPGTDEVYDMSASFSSSTAGIDDTGYICSDSRLSNITDGSLVTAANYYDNYNAAALDGFSGLTDTALRKLYSAGLLTASRQAIFTPAGNDTRVNAPYHYTLFGYDQEERVTASLSSSVISNEYCITTTGYTRQGRVTGSRESVVFPDETYSLYLGHRLDASGNIISSEATRTPSQAAYLTVGQSKVEYSYDALGRTTRMSLLPVASKYCYYSYNLRGQLKTSETQCYSQTLYYEDGSAPCFNGSVSAVGFGYECDAMSGLAWITDKVTYSYDAMGRLSKSISTDGYNTSYHYDLNSSPISIFRAGLLSDGVTVGEVDNISLTYDGNQLKTATDFARNVSLESSLDFNPLISKVRYAYDASGRMIGDSGSLVTISYATNDMPLSLNGRSTGIRNAYRADGVKLATATVGELLPDNRRVRYDLGAFRFVRYGDSGGLKLERIALPWGYFDENMHANVYIKDQQGNIRAVYDQSDNSTVQQTDYYPYGLPKASSTHAEVNRFKYSGKELSTELPMTYYDHAARMQLPALGIFQRPDPKAHDYQSINPFTYCGSDPVNFVDPTGSWYVKVSASEDRGNHPYATFTVYDRNNIAVYRTVVKVKGKSRDRTKTYADTPLGTFEILEWRETGTDRYPEDSFGPDFILATHYLGDEAPGRDGMHAHGGRSQEPDLADTNGCFRMSNEDVLEFRNVVDSMENVDPDEHMGNIYVSNNLKYPVNYRDRKDIKFNRINPGGVLPELIVTPEHKNMQEHDPPTWFETEELKYSTNHE